MTKQNLIRILSGLMFLIFFCPFFQMCSDETLNHFPFRETAIKDDTAALREDIQKETELSFQKNKKEATKSGYGLVAQCFKASSEGEFLKSDFHDPGLYLSIAFLLVLPLLFMQFILTLKGKFKMAGITGGVIILLNIICLSILSVEEILEDIAQIKYGYYLFAINLIVIISLCAKLKIKTLHDGIDW